jgi:hypothetical protein
VLSAYVHVRDAARACYLAATAPLPERSHHVLFISAQDSPLDQPTLDHVRRAYPETEARATLQGYGSLVSGARAAEVLGFVPEYSCR